jgi:hypothetical protein
LFAGQAHWLTRDEDDTELRSNGLSIREEVEELTGQSIGHKIVVFGLNAQKAIPNTTADE